MSIQPAPASRFLPSASADTSAQQESTSVPFDTKQTHGWHDAAQWGFDPQASGIANQRALQQAVDSGGTIIISQPGIYRLAGTVYLGSHTSVQFGVHTVVQKVNEAGEFSHIFLNKGALTKTWDTDISITGLTLAVNGMDVRAWQVFGLHGQVAFFYATDIRIERFRCHDLGRAQYAIHICTFEDLLIDDVHISGGKDGIHLGRGKRFHIRGGVFRTLDDAIALNAHDYDVGNPELGWIEDGTVEQCHDLNAEKNIGFFARILGGAWVDWFPGMQVQKSDTVVSDGRMYRVRADPDRRVYTSTTQPTHHQGSVELDGITWVMIQEEALYTAGVRQVTFRDIYLSNTRTGFSCHFDNDRFSRSYYPGAPIPCLDHIVIESTHVKHTENRPFVQANMPIKHLTIRNSTLAQSPIQFNSNNSLNEFGSTHLMLISCTFTTTQPFTLLRNSIIDKQIYLSLWASTAESPTSKIIIDQGPGTITCTSDLPLSTENIG